jgi:hypothetical protein
VADETGGLRAEHEVLEGIELLQGVDYALLDARLVMAIAFRRRF